MKLYKYLFYDQGDYVAGIIKASNLIKAKLYFRKVYGKIEDAEIREIEFPSNNVYEIWYG